MGYSSNVIPPPLDFGHLLAPRVLGAYPVRNCRRPSARSRRLRGCAAWLYDTRTILSYEGTPMAASRAITVRISEARLRKLMRARKAATQSELINTLLAEEEERLRSHGILRATAQTVRTADIDARLL